MTKTEAWAYLAERFDNAKNYRESSNDKTRVRIIDERDDNEGVWASGICGAIDILYQYDRINGTTHMQMNHEVQKYGNEQCITRLYYWPLIPEGHYRRAMFCREMAQK